MPDKLETSAGPRLYDLDRDRVASMAYEGGVAAAEMELEEQQRWSDREAARGSGLARWRAPSTWSRSTAVWVGALVVGAAAALLTRLALRWTRR